MAILSRFVEGWTGALPFRLDADGAATDLTGLTVRIVLRDCRDRGVLDTTEGLTFPNTTGGEVSYTASTSGLFKAKDSPYRVRFRVTDATGGIVYWPNADPGLLQVEL